MSTVNQGCTGDSEVCVCICVKTPIRGEELGVESMLTGEEDYLAGVILRLAVDGSSILNYHINHTSEQKPI